MAEAGHVRIGVVGPRPLGLVKRESVHFEDGEGSMEESWTSSSRATAGLGSRSQQRTELRSMRNLQETLRQAALLNIVAAVNHDDPPGAQSAGIKGSSLLGHTVGGGARKLVLVHGSSGDYSSGAFSRHMQAPPVPPNTASTPGAALGTLLSQRTRTISIPRPRTQSEQTSFMHNSLRDAKEQLVNMTSFRSRSSLDMDAAGEENKPPPHTSGGQQPAQSQAKPAEVKFKSRSAEGTYAVHGVGVDATPGSDLREPPTPIIRPTPSGGEPKSTGRGAQAPSRSKEDKRAHTVQQMQSLKRHISTSKKKELMNKLTEMAKCEAVDMSEPVRRGADKGAPSIIILAQKREVEPQPRAQASGGSQRAVVDFTDPVPTNTRVQSESAEAMTAYRQAKGLQTFQVGDNLRIESISAPQATGNDIDHAIKRDGKKNFLDNFQSNVIDLNTWVREHLFSDSIVGKTMQSPDLMELRPVDSITPSPAEREFAAEKRRFMASRRMHVSSVRDKLYSPSPVVYEASYHRPKASIGQISLVGQSLPSLTALKSPAQPSKPGSKRVSSENTRAPSQEDEAAAENEEAHLRHLGELPDRKQVLTLGKPWGSTSKQPSSASPILRTEILDHLQCVGIIDRRPPNISQKKSISKISGINKVGLGNDEPPEPEFFDEGFDHCSESGVLATRPEYRKSKLYSAFRASEENLATAVDTVSLVSENLTTRSLLNQPPVPAPAPAPESAKPSLKEPLYMGCSSMVSEHDIGSQFHYVNGEDSSTSKKGASFKVLKALDHDVYSDFQHRKYRSGTNSGHASSLNTTANKPSRMHFLKIKFPGET